MSVISSGDIGGLSAGGLFLLAVGGGIGRKFGSTKKHKAAETNAIQQLTWVVGGKPADQFNTERTPGLIEQMKELAAGQREFEANTTAMFSKLLERAERSEDSVKTATAIAAKAVLDTASVVATEKNDAAAIASAEVLATAIAAKLALLVERPTRPRRVAAAK